MLILVTILSLFVTALVLVFLQLTRPNYRFAWLIAVGGAFLAWGSILAWQARMPLELSLPAWGTVNLFSSSLSFLAEPVIWAYALAISTLGLAMILTAVARPNFPGVYTWAGTLALTGFGLLAVLADNPLTLVIIWAGLDLAELVSQLVSVEGGRSTQRVVTGFGTRVLGIALLLWAGLSSLWHGMPLDFRSPPPEAAVYMLLAAGLRMGVLPLHLPYGAESNTRRGFGTVLRLVSAASSLVILARIPAGGIASPVVPYLLILTAAAGLYGGWMWVRSSDELAGRPYWIIALASLAVAAALRGNPTGSVAWGVALVLAGGALFFSSIQNRNLQRILVVVGLWGISALPFSPTASGWQSNAAASWAVFIAVPVLVMTQALLAAGFIRHGLSSSGTVELDPALAWTRNIYPVGIGLPLAVLILLGVWGWDGALTIGNIPEVAAAVILVLVVLRLIPRVRWLNPIRAHYVGSGKPGTSRLDGIYNSLNNLYISFGRFAHTLADVLEGDGGILWTLLFIVLYLSLLAPRTP
jgi:hypothetical protein